MKYDLVISGMIRSEHGRFWNLVAERLEKEGLKVAFLPAMDEAALPLQGRKDDVFCIPEEIRRRDLAPPTPAEIAEIEKRYGLLSLRHLYIHEMYSTERYDEARLREKVIHYFRVCTAFFEENEVGAVVQETGGWIECQVVFRIARALGLPHLFIEPGPMRDTVVFARNAMTVQFDEVLPGKALSDSQREAVKVFVDRTTAAAALLVPHKDRTYYKDATFFNLVTPDTFSKLGRILHRKAFINKFNETFSTRKLIFRYLKSIVRRKLLTRYYRRFPEAPGPFIYFPLHMPFDMQILVRAPQFFRQENVVEMMSRALPQGVRLFIKEHPVSIGWYPYPILRDLARLPNVVLLHPSVSSHDVVRKARAVLTINSKVGFEALAYYKPVITLGASFYRGHGATLDVTDLATVAEVVVQALKAEVDREAVDGLLATVGERCHPGELYDPAEENIARFTDALLEERTIIGAPNPR